MMNQKVMAVFGYNNTRSYDVAKIRTIVRNRIGAEVVLVKEGVDSADRDLAPYCLDHPPQDPGIAEVLRRYLTTERLELVGCLPFSDKGVIGAAHVSREFGLFGDDVESASAMLDKGSFRFMEKDLVLPASLYKKPDYRVANTRAEVESFFLSHGPFFLKPTSEGNSRGCMKIESMEDLECWFLENPGVIFRGAICEELLSLSNEFSFDGVAGKYWITQKFTTSGAYRAEYQHIVPAPLPPERYDATNELLGNVITSLGSRGGAFHHEFFLLPDGRAASVEPNRRPAGMWIWDLAGWAFEEFDPWMVWIERCAGREVAPGRLIARRHAGVRGVISRASGIVEEVRTADIETELSRRFGNNEFRLSVLKSRGDVVRSEPRDNSDFLAFVALRDRDPERLQSMLVDAEHIVLSGMEVRS